MYNNELIIYLQTGWGKKKSQSVKLVWNQKICLKSVLIILNSFVSFLLL